MYSSRLGLVGRLVVALLAVFMLGAVAASAAWAEEAPRWKVGGVILKKNETKAITVKPFSKTIVLGVPKLSQTITCEEVKVKAGAFIAGSEPGEPGTSTSTDEFSKCTQTGNGSEPGCKVKEPIVTEPVRSELVENIKLTTYLTEFDPTAGSETNFVIVKYEGSCLLKEAPIKGLVVGSNYTDPTVAEGKEEPVGPSSTRKEYKSFLIKFPDEEKKIWLWEKGVHKEFEYTPLKFTSDEATLTGTVLVLLASGGEYGAEG